MKKRGIIITPTFHVTSDGSLRSQEPLDPAYLRKCLLYWDYIDLPESIVGASAVGQAKDDVKILQQENILRRTRAHFVKKDGDKYILTSNFEYPTEFWIMAQLYTLLNHQTSEIRWVLGQSSPVYITPDFDITKFIFIEPGSQDENRPGYGFQIKRNPLLLQTGPTIDIELFNALPVPHPEEPIDKILEFKNKRGDEFARFQYALDEMFDYVVGSGNQGRALDHSVDKIDRAISDLHRVMDISKFKRVRSSIKVKLSLDTLVKTTLVGVAAGWFARSLIDLPQVCAIIGAIGGASLKVTYDPAALKPTLPSDVKDFAYLYYVQSELKKNGPKQ